jgi:hypothetical protein
LNGPLLEVVRGLLERTFHMRSGLGALAPFIIGDRGYHALYGAGRQPRGVGSPGGQGAKTMVRETTDGVAACIYFPDSLIDRLEAHPPNRGVGQENLLEFATFVEEIDHLLMIAERSRDGRPISLFELELHANVSKHLVLTRFLAGAAPRLAAERRLWLRHELFDGVRYCDDDPATRQRYRDAARWAIRLLDGLTGIDAARCVARLRQFHVADVPSKLRMIAEL